MRIILLCMLLVAFTSGCSINKMAVNMVADMLSGDDSTVFTGEADPELLNEALPFALKLYETLLESANDNPGLYLSTGKAFCLYAFSAVQIPAEISGNDDYDEKQAALLRAKKLFLRARRYLFTAIDLTYPGFSDTALKEKDLSEFLDRFKKEDVPYLYWLSMAWMGAFSIDSFDMELLVSLPKVYSLLERIMVLDEAYDEGGVHDILISYFGSLPPEMGGSEQKARENFLKAVEMSKGKRSSPYLSLATSVCINNQYLDEFIELLTKVTDMDVNESPENRLMNTLNQRKAKWLLEHKNEYFLVIEDDDTSLN
ncbi:MAG: TRAP transporter TatT component family protein [Spirochaetales bacterium]|nr:TRAP transporter TatT component family protein [Spirochaetales bacterium]